MSGVPVRAGGSAGWSQCCIFVRSESRVCPRPSTYLIRWTEDVETASRRSTVCAVHAAHARSKWPSAIVSIETYEPVS